MCPRWIKTCRQRAHICLTNHLFPATLPHTLNSTRPPCTPPFRLSGEPLQAAWLQRSPLRARGSPRRAYPNSESLLGAQVHSSTWNHSGNKHTVRAQLMSHSKSLILADILHFLVEIWCRKVIVECGRKRSLSTHFLTHSLSMCIRLSATYKSLHEHDPAVISTTPELNKVVAA